MVDRGRCLIGLRYQSVRGSDHPVHNLFRPWPIVFATHSAARRSVIGDGGKLPIQPCGVHTAPPSFLHDTAPSTEAGERPSRSHAQMPQSDF